MTRAIHDSVNVAMVGMWPPPVGGVARTCQSLAAELTRQGDKVVFIDVLPAPGKQAPAFLRNYYCFQTFQPRSLLRLGSSLLARGDSSSASRLRCSAGRLLRVSALVRRPHYLVGVLERVREMAGWLRQESIHVVHGHHAGIYSLAGLLVARHWLRCPFVVTVYASEFTMNVNRRWLPVARRVCREADGVICISDYTRRVMLAGRAVPRRVEVVPLACQPSCFRPPPAGRIETLRRRFSLVSAAPVILFVGHLVPRKGPQTLVEALQHVRDLPWQALFVGPDFGFGGKLQQRAEMLGIAERLRFTGVATEKDLGALYELGDLFVFPTCTSDEGFGLVGLEAMAHGLPVVGARAGAIPELVECGETGFLFTPGNDRELGAHLRTLLLDAALRARMERRARARARRYSWSQTARRVHQFYQAVLRTP